MRSSISSPAYDTKSSPTTVNPDFSRTPVVPADPVADQELAGHLEAHDVSGNLLVEHDRALRHGGVAEDLRLPVLHERVAVPGRERRHAVRDRIALMLEEDGKIVFGHVPQPDPGRRCL